MAAQNLSSADVTALCAAADAAWNNLGPRQKRAPFSWRGRRYVASRTVFRLCVHNAVGALVACRYE